MYRILLVDDEAIIRKGLKNVIDWASMDCIVVGEASSGLEGMELIKALKPDIVITDIKMPGINGLEMIEKTKEIVPCCKIIILTGFRDFEYLQKSIKLGAFDYLLKPSKIEDITNIIKNAIISLNKSKEKEEEFNKLKIEFEKQIPFLRQKLLYDILFKITYKDEEILEQLKLYNIIINDFILLIVQIESKNYQNNNQYEKQLYQFGIINAFEESFEKDFIIYDVPINNKEIIFIVESKEYIENFKELVYSMVDNLNASVNSCFGFSITVAISTLGKGFKDLPYKVKEAEEALEYKIYIGDNSIIPYQDLKAFYRGIDFSLLEDFQKILIKYIKIGNEENVRLTLNEINKYLKDNKINIDSIRNYFNNIVYSIKNIASVEIDNSLYEKFKDLLSNTKYNNNEYDYFNILLNLVEEISLKTASKINFLNHKTINSTLQRAIDYINEHYAENITLSSVSEYSFVSTFYLSRMFTKELGKNFIDYINEVKIEKAKIFLKNTSYKTYEIAEMIGVKDAHYFSKLFKKYTGYTPSEYKDSNIL